MSAKSQEAHKPALQMPLRLWPGVVAVVLLFLVRFGVPIVAPEAAGTAVMGGLVGGLAVFVWWTFFSRAPRFERWGAVPLMVVAMVVTRSLLDESVATAGMGMLFYLYAIPVTSLALVVWAVATQHLPARPRRVSMVVTILLASGVWTLVRTGGIIQVPPIRTSRGGGPRRPRSGYWPRPATSRWRTCRRRRLQRREPTGPPFAARVATAPSPVCGSTPTGQRRRRSSCGDGRSARAGRRFRSVATFSTPRSSVVTMRSLPATGSAPASPCGDTGTRPGSGSQMAAPVRAGRRPSMMVAPTHSVRPGSSTRSMPMTAPSCGRGTRYQTLV